MDFIDDGFFKTGKMQPWVRTQNLEIKRHKLGEGE